MAAEEVDATTPAVEALDSDDQVAAEATEAAEQAETKAAEPAAAPEPKNAMHESHLRAGKNSYYYAHTRTPDGPVWDKKAEPRLLSRQASSTSAGAGCVPITDYMWADSGAKVKVYVPLEGVGEAPEESLQLEWDENSLAVSVADFDGVPLRALRVPRLYAEIENAVLRQKPNKLIITLTKKTEFTWNLLKKD